MSKKKYIVLIWCAIVCGIMVGCITRMKNKTDVENIEDTKQFLSENMGVEYQINEDGTYICEGNVYLYKLLLEGKDNSSGKNAKIIVLTNNGSLTFDDVFNTLISSQINASKPDYVILGLE